jgi:hypothetical protein
MWRKGKSEVAEREEKENKIPTVTKSLNLKKKTHDGIVLVVATHLSLSLSLSIYI